MPCRSRPNDAVGGSHAAHETHGAASAVRLVVSIALVGLMGCGGKDAHGPPPADVWRLEAVADDLTRPPFRIGEFEIRPPSELRFVRQDGPDSYIWAGPTRPDNSHFSLTVIVTEIPADEVRITPAEHLRDILGELRKDRPDFQTTGVQPGRLNGYSFERSNWTGSSHVGAQNGMPALSQQGAVYVGLFNHRGVVLMFQDITAAGANSIQLGERAVATFRPAPPAP